MQRSDSKYFSSILTVALVMILITRPVGIIKGSQKQLLPTEALHLIFEEKGKGGDQYKIGQKHLPEVKKTDLSADEKFAMAEVYFAAGLPDQALTAYEQLTEGTDLHARMAQQRVLFLTMVGRQQFDGMEEKVHQYRSKFSPTKEDLYHLSEVIFILASHYEEQKDHQKVVDLVTDEVQSLPSDAPYYSFSLPATFFKSFKEVGKQDFAIKTLQKAHDLYDAELKGKQKLPADKHVVHQPGVFHRVEEGLAADYPPGSYADPTLTMSFPKVNSILASNKAPSDRSG